MKEPNARHAPEKKIQPNFGMTNNFTTVFRWGVKRNYPHPWIVIGAVMAAVIIALIFSINSYYREYWDISDYIAQMPIPQKEAALIEFDFGEDGRRLFRGEVAKEIYPLDAALRSAAENGNFTFQVKDGVLVEIAGMRGNWSIYRNGEKISTVWDGLNITGGDRYTFRYEK